MNISPVKINNVSRPVNFGMLKTDGTINPSTLKTLMTDDNFIELVKDSDDNGFDTVVKGNMRDCSICVEDKNNSLNHKYLSVSSYYEPLDTNFALGNWNEFKKQLSKKIVKEDNKIAIVVGKMVEQFNRNMGFID